MEILIKITDGKVETNIDTQSSTNGKSTNGQVKNENGTSTVIDQDAGIPPQWLYDSFAPKPTEDETDTNMESENGILDSNDSDFIDGGAANAQ
ncbi:MAG: hypothetical protein AB8H03_19035 [Saprospiraceae bacterium]